MRKGAVTFVIGCIFALGALVAAPSAFAEEEIPVASQPYNQSAYDASLANLLKTETGKTLLSRASPEELEKLRASGLISSSTRLKWLSTFYYRAVMDYRAAPALNFLGNITMLGTAATYEFKFAKSDNNPFGAIYKKLTGDEYATDDSSLVTGDIAWGRYGPAGSTTVGTSCVSGLSVAGFDPGGGYTGMPCGWYLFGANAGGGLLLCNIAATDTPCGTNTAQQAASSIATEMIRRIGSWKRWIGPVGNGGCFWSGGSSSTCAMAYRTWAQMQQAVQVEDSTAAAYAAAPASRKTDLGTYTVPTYNGTDLANARTAIDNSNTDTRNVINVILDPTYEPAQSTPTPTTTVTVEPTVAPAPGTDETDLDFTPVTDIDFGCKFPYGFTCYAVDVTEWFNVSPDAPSFSFELDDFDTPIGDVSLGTYGPVDLNILDEYMVIWRALLSVVLWIGAVYWIAVNFLGFRAGGDPGAAMDDIL